MYILNFAEIQQNKIINVKSESIFNEILESSQDLANILEI